MSSRKSEIATSRTHFVIRILISRHVITSFSPRGLAILWRIAKCAHSNASHVLSLKGCTQSGLESGVQLWNKRKFAMFQRFSSNLSGWNCSGAITLWKKCMPQKWHQCSAVTFGVRMTLAQCAVMYFAKGS